MGNEPNIPSLSWSCPPHFGSCGKAWQPNDEPAGILTLTDRPQIHIWLFGTAYASGFPLEVALTEALVEHHPKHNETSFKPGNQVNLVHGASSNELMKPMPGHPPPVPVQALIDWAFEVWDHLRDGDYPLARTWAYLQHRVNQMEIFYDGTTNQSILDHKGVPRKGSGTYKDLLNSKRELEKVLGIGPAPRAQMAQQIASSGKDFGLAKEAAARLRAKVKVLPPNDSPQFPPTPGDAPSEDLSNSPEPNSA